MCAALRRAAGGARATRWPIAEQCDLELEFGRLELPAARARVPRGETPDAYLERASAARGPAAAATARHARGRGAAALRARRRRADRLRGLHPVRLGLRRATPASQGIPCGPRGSAAGRIILYCLGISDVDPIALRARLRAVPEPRAHPDARYRHGLRRRPPRRGHRVRRRTLRPRPRGADHHLRRRWRGRRSATSAARWRYPLSDVDRVAKLVPTLPVGITIDQALEDSPELKDALRRATTARQAPDRHGAERRGRRPPRLAPTPRASSSRASR